MLYDRDGADGRLDVDGETAVGTDDGGDDTKEAFFGALLSRFEGVEEGSSAEPPIRPAPSEPSDTGDLSALVRGLSSPISEDGDGGDDGELADFISSIQSQDKDGEAAKVLSELESMAPSPDGEAYLPNTPLTIDIPKAPDPEDLTSPGLTLRELFGLDGDEAVNAPPPEPPPAAPQDPLAPRRLFADRRLYHFVRELVPDAQTFAILRFLLTSGLDRLTLGELEGCLVQQPEALRPRLEALVTGGLIVAEGGRFSLNPRSRNALVLGQLVATWNEPGGRERIWAWLKESQPD